MTKFTYVDSEEGLQKACTLIARNDIIAVDIECENNLHHYGTHLSIIQISSGDKHWVVDALTIKNMKPLIDIFLDKSKQKIFHDVDFDFRMLERTYGCRPKNIFDTQIAALLAGKTDIGLGTLLEEYFHVKKERKYQMADWLKRPIAPDMLEYAVKDTVYLVRLRGVLLKELKQLDRLAWCKQEFKYLENKDFIYHEQEYIDVKGVKGMNAKERAIFKRLFDVREKLAKKVDRPVHFILSTKRMREFAQQPPTLSQWKKMQQVHPVLRSQAHLFHEAVQKGKQERENIKLEPRRRFSQKQKALIEKITAARDTIAEQKNLQPHLIANKEQIREIVVTGEYKCLRSWQEELIRQKL